MKQDSAWDVGGSPASGSASGGAASVPTPGATPTEKESNIWTSGGGNRNDGTDLWKSTLYGQPPATVGVVKPQSNSSGGGAWNPQNNTDFKQWGVDEEEGQGGHSAGPGSAGGSSNGAPRNDSMWGGDSNNGPASHFGGNNEKPRPDWGQGSSSRSWADQPRDQMMGGSGGAGRGMDPMPHREVGGNNGGWGPAPQRPISQWNSVGGNNANSGGQSRNAAQNSWDESPSMQRKMDDGTGHWKQPSNNAPGPAGTLNIFLLSGFQTVFL